MNFEIYICLTTIPSRIKTVYKTIKSLINQSYRSHKIILSIPNKYIRFENNIDREEIDLLIKMFNNYKNNNDEPILYVNIINKDYGPGTKLLGALHIEEVINSVQSYIVLVDDDVIYVNNFIENFCKLLSFNKNIVASNYVYKLYDINIGQGVDGFLIPIKYLDCFLKFFNIIENNNYKELYKYIIFHDDVYISYYFFLINIEIVFAGISNSYFIHNDIDGLVHNYDNRILFNEIIIPILNVLFLKGLFLAFSKKKCYFIYKNKPIFYIL